MYSRLIYPTNPTQLFFNKYFVDLKSGITVLAQNLFKLSMLWKMLQAQRAYLVTARPAEHSVC